MGVVTGEALTGGRIDGNKRHAEIDPQFEPRASDRIGAGGFCAVLGFKNHLWRGELFRLLPEIRGRFGETLSEDPGCERRILRRRNLRRKRTILRSHFYFYEKARLAVGAICSGGLFLSKFKILVKPAV